MYLALMATFTYQQHKRHHRGDKMVKRKRIKSKKRIRTPVIHRHRGVQRQHGVDNLVKPPTR